MLPTQHFLLHIMKRKILCENTMQMCNLLETYILSPTISSVSNTEASSSRFVIIRLDDADAKADR